MLSTCTILLLLLAIIAGIFIYILGISNPSRHFTSRFNYCDLQNYQHFPNK